MDDKTTSILQPSTTFDDSYKSTTHSRPYPAGVHQHTTHKHTTKNIHLPGINNLLNMNSQPSYEAPKGIFSPPEEALMDSFTPIAAKPYTMMGLVKTANTQAPLSPPVSPESKSVTPDDASTIVVRDPILFPAQDATSSSPLFNPDNEIHRSVERHLASREPSAFRAVSPPRTDEYRLALEFKSQVARVFNANRRLWAQRELAQLREDNQLRMGGRRYTTIAPAMTGGVRPARVAKPSVRASKQINAVKSSRPPKQSVPRGMTPEKRVAREDKDFESLPNYCPPVSSLPNKPNSLKVDWKGAPIDLKSDPHAHLLHPDELYLAANLRLDCATYLTSKRRIFINRIEAYKRGKEFRKTDAQQACKIDVNKASKLWQAFDKVGWLKPQWIMEFV